jgi:hypothetical protein
MTRIILALLLLFSSIAAHAAVPGPSEKIPAGGVLRGAFTEEHYFTNDKPPLKSEGLFMVAPGRGIIWTVTKPLPLTFVFTPKGMAQSIAGLPLMQTKVKNMPVVAQISGLIGSAMAGDWDALDKVFIVSGNPTPTGWSANLKPRDAKGGLPFSTLTAEGNRYVNSAKALRLDGGLENFTFSAQSISPTPPSATEEAAFAAVKE